MTDFVRWMYGGQDKRFFVEHQQDIHDYNVKMMSIVNIVATLIFTLYCVFAMVSGVDEDFAIYVVMLIIMIPTYIIFKVFATKSVFWTKIFIQLDVILLTALLEFQSLMEPKDLAVFIPAFLILVPIMLLIPVTYAASYGLVTVAVTVILEFIFKHDYMYNVVYDTVDCLICLGIGLVLGQTVLKSRLQQIDSFTKLKINSETELAKALKLANTDTLTGVGSRTAYERVCEELDEQIRQKADVRFGFIVCDVNNLKERNDVGGHYAGDELIVGTAKLICEVFNRNSVFRIGGDEFIIVLRDSEYDMRSELLNSMRARIQRISDNISFASGMAVYDPAHDTDIHSVFIKADAAMYDNKKFMKLVMSTVD